MTFYPDCLPEVGTTYTDPPKHLERRLLRSFTKCYIQGKWGWLLEQRIILPSATCWLFDLQLSAPTRFFARCEVPFYGIVHVIIGSMHSVPEGYLIPPVQSGTSASWYVPPCMHHPVCFTAGSHQWWVVHWHPDFLRERGLFENVLHRAAQEPASFYQDLHTTAYPWASVLRLLHPDPAPSLLLEARLLDALRVYHPVPVTTMNELETKVRAARHLIEDRLHEPLTIRMIARSVSLNESALKTGFKQLYGTTVYDCLYEARMQRALQLVQQTDRLIQDVANACGYRYASHFTKMFSQRFGRGPQELRQFISPRD